MKSFDFPTMIFNSDEVVEYELLELDTDSIGTLQLDSSIQLEVDFTIAREARSLRYFMLMMILSLLYKLNLFELVVIIFWSNQLFYHNNNFACSDFDQIKKIFLDSYTI